MVSNKACVICDCPSEGLRPAFVSLIPTVPLPGVAVKDVCNIFTRILIVSENESINQICIDCFGEIQRTYYFVDKCEKAQLKLLNETVSKTVENSNESLIAQAVSPELNETLEELPSIERNVAELDTELNANTTEAGDEVEILWSFTVNCADSRIRTENTESVSSTSNNGDVSVPVTGATSKEPFGNSENEEDENFSENEEHGNFSEDEEHGNFSEDEENGNFSEDEDYRNFSEDEEYGNFSEHEEESEKIQYTRILRSRKTTNESGHSTSMQAEIRNNQTGKENSNVNSNQISCAICSKNFRKKQNLRIHLLMHAKMNRFECRSCSKMFRSQAKLKLHMRRAHSVIKHVCTICSKEFNNLKIHMKKSSCKSKTKPQLKCSMCIENFDSKLNLSQHLLTHEKSNAPFTCTFCPNQYSCAGHLRTHLLSHSDERTINCYKCSKNFKYPQSLGKHLRRMHPELKHRCTICFQKFEKEQQLRLHQTKMHKYKCNICSKYFQSTSSLDEHITKEHPCRFCGKIFTCFLDFEKHMEAEICISDRKKDRQCIICWKIFSRKDKLERHLLIHSGERLFKCDFCTFTFTRNDTLIIHKRRMHNVK